MLTEPFPGEQLKAARERLEQVRALDGESAPEQQALLSAAYDDLRDACERLEADRAALVADNVRLRHQVQDALLRNDEARALLDTLLSRAPVGLSFLDPQLRYVLINDALAAINGRRADDHIGKHIEEIIPDIGHRLLGVYRKVLETGEPVLDFEITGTTPADPIAPRHFLASYYPVDAPDGRRLGVGAVVADITDRKQAEQELRQSRDQLAIILRGVTDGITVQDATGRLIFVNETAARLLGFASAEEMMALPIDVLMEQFELMNELGEPLPHDELPGRRALRGEQAPKAVVRGRFRVSGEEHWAIVESTPILDDHGRAQLAINIFRDITERKRTEELLRFRAEASNVLAASLDYETTLQTVARLVVPYLADWCGVDLLDEDGSVKHVAVAHVQPEKVEWARRLRANYPLDMNARTGMPKVLRSGVAEFYGHIDDAMLVATARDEEHLRLMREVGFNSVMIVPLVARGRTLGALTFVSAESGRHYAEADLRIAEDLAHRAAMAVDNARLYQEAQEAIHVRDEFLSIAAHELKTPVTSLLAYAQVLERRAVREKTASERDLRALQVIGQQANRLSRLISSLLDLSRIETGHFTIEREQVDLGLLARRAVEEMQPTLDLHALEFTAPSEPLILEGDEMRLEQAIQNLLQNAVKYSPSGGSITVRVERNGDRAALAISDQGMGIPEDAQGQLFQRFFRARNVDGSHISGMGIGLYVVKEIITRHSGQVDVRSKEGEGTTFTVVLPLAPQPGAGSSSDVAIPTEGNAAA